MVESKKSNNEKKKKKNKDKDKKQPREESAGESSFSLCKIISGISMLAEMLYLPIRWSASSHPLHWFRLNNEAIGEGDD